MMYKFKASLVPRLILPAVLFFGVQAFAQFEIAPDHFDSTDQKKVTKNTVKPAQTGLVSSSCQISHAGTATAAHTVQMQAARHLASARKTPAGGSGKHSITSSRIAAVPRRRTNPKQKPT